MTPSVNANPRDHQYAIGIDLGTTNTAVTYVDLEEKPDRPAGRTLHTFEILQLVGPGELGYRPVLPSFLYLPGPHELPEGSTALPWAPDRSYAVGAFAQEQGARVPGRLVASAKSWLCNTNVDRTAPILPWGAPDEVGQVSPVEATTRYLTHLREAWNHAHPEAPLDKQLIILTVPASFDEVARELTVEAAERAGLPHVILLEEPLAAFYAWLDTRDDQRDQLQDGELILVCDVGGGTTDFSIIGIQRDEDDLQFDRLAVGDHLMLGGDNMDYALGRTAEAALTGETGRLDVQRWHQLVHQCRQAKEQLLRSEDGPDEVTVTVAGHGSRLIADTLSGHLNRSEAQQLVVEGFFPDTDLDAPLKQDRRAGLTELGLPYEQDPAITRQLAAFWKRTQPYLLEKTGRTTPRPDYILFNGGVFTSAPLRERTKHVLGQWFQLGHEAAWMPTELRNERLDLAVATGAAYYGLVRLGEGTRVGSGSPRSYYVGFETNTMEMDGPGQPAICLVPRGAPEGFEGRLGNREFEALANQPATFHLFSSNTRSGDAPGDVVRLQNDDEVSALPPVRTVLAFGKRYARAVPVQLAVRLTEVGTLQLWCESVHTEHRWRLQFDVRQDADPERSAPAADDVIDAGQVEAALTAIRDTFTGKQNETQPDTLWDQLENIFDEPRAHWPLPLLRKCADALLDTPRDRSAEHEALWFDLLGYCLRPGYGDSVDEWRMQQAWILHLDGLHFPRKEENRTAWWIFWRRVAGGLPANKQEQLYYEARPFIQPQVRTRKDHAVYSRHMKMREKEEAWKTLATFERVSVDIKTALAKLLLDKFKKDRPRPGELWALSRLGARHPAYGPLDKLVPADEVVSWLDTLLNMRLKRTKSAAYALVHLACYTGDRNRDVSEAMRERVSRWLRNVQDPAPYRALLNGVEKSVDREGHEWFIVEPLPSDASAVLDPQGITVTSAGEVASDA